MRVFPAPALLHGAPSERDASVRTRAYIEEGKWSINGSRGLELAYDSYLTCTGLAVALRPKGENQRRKSDLFHRDSLAH